ncbi:MAG TPA: serine hydrolase [Bradyrhizobium sp.]|uniref:serine hydrolase domain-containing protein n=1 Tax=Bradyrhizobium sp. TaxID=376 RepID=UPI002D7F1D20|nr:serine hydrolase [Bradyrhizobium sp.]HET7886517.1 serine hydrolase [Bradyrhizobium sp.]
MSSRPLMSGFPSPESAQVTLANWRTAPYMTWAFQHVREIVPSADIANSPGDIWRLESATTDLSSFAFKRGGETYSLSRFTADTDTDGLVILHRGKVIHTHYGNGMTAATPHILMSVSKSLTAIVAGILIDKGTLDPDQTVVSIIPELKSSLYASATVRHVLDMRIGIDFDEDYLATSGAIVEYRKATNWNPLAPGEQPSDLRTYLSGLVARNGPDGGPFHYVSTNSDLLGWILERASGIRFADLISNLLWKPMGAEYPAYITVDRLGAPRCAGGICTTAMDLARVGQLIVQNGRRNGPAIIPAGWIEDVFDGGDPNAWAAGDMIAYFGDRAMHYRNKWYVLRDSGIAFGLGVYGQNVFVDRANELVIAKLSSQPPPLDANLIDLTIAFVEAIRGWLTRT